MGKNYNQLTIALRDRIAALKNSGHSHREIAVVLGVHHTTVGRELIRNSYGTDDRTPRKKRGKYDPGRAQHKAYTRRKCAKYQGQKIQADHRLESFIKTNVQLDWTPDEMAGYMKLHQSRLGFYASKTTIYEWFDSVSGQPYQRFLPKHRNRPKKRLTNKMSRVMISDRISVHDRPEAIDNRSEAGHWEYDSIVSSKRSGATAALAVAQERTSRLLCARQVADLKPNHYANVITGLVAQHKTLSLTTDNGMENRSHALITGALSSQPAVYFTDPYASWQKGGVENGNKMLRKYFPKGTDFSTITQTDVEYALMRINNKPRKILGYRSALQVAKAEGVLLGGGAVRG